MVFSNLEKDIGLDSPKMSGKIFVSAYCWSKTGSPKNVIEVHTTRAKLHNAFQQKKRYSMSKLLELNKQGSPETLQALAYRAAVSDKNGGVVGEKNTCDLAVFKE